MTRFRNVAHGGISTSAWIVELDSLGPSGDVTRAIHGVLGGARQGPGRPLEAAIEDLRDRDGWLVLDSCEVVLPAVRSVVEAVASAGWPVRALTGLRTSLGRSGRQALRPRTTRSLVRSLVRLLVRKGWRECQGALYPGWRV